LFFIGLLGERAMTVVDYGAIGVLITIWFLIAFAVLVTRRSSASKSAQDQETKQPHASASTGQDCDETA